MTHFPGAVQILDYYHAAGHLAEWKTLLYDGETLQLIHEMKRCVAKLTDTDTDTDTDGGWKQINYFVNNQQRMDYGRYRATGWPIGSGSVEGQCKFVVGRRFKRQRDEMEAARQRMCVAYPLGGAER